METILTGYPSLPSKLWGRMQGWYSAAVDHAPPPARITLKRITAERKELYRAFPTHGGDYSHICAAILN